MAKKNYLNVRPGSVPVTLLGISCHLKDYRLSYLFNHHLGLSFSKLDDLNIRPSLTRDPADFSMYFCRNEERLNTYFLLSNRSQDFILVPELKQFDFLLIVEGKYLKSDKEMLISTLKSLPGILTIFERKSSEIRNFESLLTDIELHVLNIQKVPKTRYQPK